MREWRVDQVHESSNYSQTNWRFEGDITLDLFLRKFEEYGPEFEMARLLDHSSLADLLKDELRDCDYETLKETGSVTDLILTGADLEELEQYCREHFLPMPPGSKEKYGELLAR